MIQFRIMRSDVIVLPEPCLDPDLRLTGRREPLGVDTRGILTVPLMVAWPMIEGFADNYAREGSLPLADVEFLGLGLTVVNVEEVGCR